MDLDWCPCGMRLEGKSAYCSQKCQRTDRFTFEDCYNDDSASSSDLDDDNDDEYHHAEQKRHHAHPHSSSSSSSNHHHHHRPRYDDIRRAFEAQQWPGHDRNNILAWANNVPLGCSGGSVRPESLTYGSQKLRAPTFPLSRQRPVPPALCMSTTQTQSQSQSQATRVAATPLAASTNQQRRRAPSSARDGSASSLVSALTDSIATPLSEEVSNAAVAVAVAAPAPAIPSAARSKAGVFDGLTSRFGWGHTEKEHQHQHHQIPRRFEERGFTVLSTAHLIESLADSDEPALFPPVKKSTTTTTTSMEPKMTAMAMVAGKESRGVSIVAKDAMYAKKERAPVSLKVERMYGEDHPAYRARGRKAARAAAAATASGRA